MTRLMVAVLVALAVASGAVAAHAATTAQIDAARDKGLAWLITHQNRDGSWRSVAGTEVAATSAAIDALGVANVKTEPYAVGVAWLSNATIVSVDSLARQIATLSTAGLRVTTPVQTLLAWRNTRTAWGAYNGFQTTSPDTALALAAIRLSQSSYTDVDLFKGYCRMLVAQGGESAVEPGSWTYTEGGWLAATLDPPTESSTPGTYGRPAILPTVYNLIEIDAIRRAKGWESPQCNSFTYPAGSAITNGLTWLTTHRRNADGGFGDNGVSTVLETALAYQALATLSPSDPAVGPALDYLVLSTQKADGSWNGDPFQTAMVLKVIPIGTAYLDTDRDGVPDRIEAQVGTNPAVIDNRWMARGNGVTSVVAPTAANDFGILTTSVASATVATTSPALPDRNGAPGVPAALAVQPTIVSQNGAATARRSGNPGGVDALADAVSTEAFQVDRYTGGAVAEVPIAVPPGTGGVAPSVVLRYDSVTADALTASDPAQGTGLGWTLVFGPIVVRDHKGTTTTADDTFVLVQGTRRYDLVADATAGVYHTRDEAFARITYSSTGDYWTVTTKDGTRYELGNSTDSKQATLVASPWTTRVTYRYFVDDVRSPTGVSIKYTYTKDIASVGSQPYDQSIYLATIAYASVNGSAVGTPRTVTLSWSSRTDWSTSTSAPKHFETKKLEAIDVKLDGVLVRRYSLTYDYASIDRAPGVTWAGGATGDLALKTLTLVGTDGVAALPAASFSYDATTGRLLTVSNGLGGQVTFVYGTIGTTTLYSVCSEPSCADWGVCTDANPAGFPASALLGYLLTSPQVDTVAIYSVCRTAGLSGCADWGIAAGSGSTLLGYAFTTTLPQLPGTLGLYSISQGGWKAVAASTQPPGGTLLGYVYPSTTNPNRYGRVATRTLDDGRSLVATMSYTYSDLALNPDASVRGYGSVQVTDPAGTYVNTYFNQSDDVSGRIYQADTYSGPTLVQRVVNTWTIASPYPMTAPTVKAVNLTQTDVSTYDGGVAITTRKTWHYDAYSNLTIARSEGDLAVTGDEREERTDWVVNATAWVHRPSRIVLATGAGATVRERWLSYDNLVWGSVGAAGLLTRDERRLVGPRGTAGNAVLTTGYDAYGNATSSTDAGGCATTTTYDAPTSAVPTAMITCLGHTTTFAYDAYARRTSVTDANHQTTGYTFDALGRLTKVTGPLDTASAHGSVTYQYLHWGTLTTQLVRTLKTKLHGQPLVTWTDEYFDGRGRVYLRQSPGPGAGQVIAQTREFNTRGWLDRRSAPYLSGTETAKLTSYVYDPLGRVTRVQYPDSTVVATMYGGVAGLGALATVTDERGSVKRFYVDAYAQVVRVDEVNGATTATTTYAYDPAGSLTTIVPAVGAATTFAYDALGRRTSMSDPNLGVWTWAYDTRGNMTTQTDARNQTTTFTYDLASRVKTKTYPGGAQIVWTYDEPNAGAPYTLERVTTLADGIASTTYTYDALGRVTRLSRVIDGSPYVMQQTYDAAGHVLTRTFPDSEQVTYAYNDAGWLERIVGYVEAAGGAAGITYDARGQRVGTTYSSGAVTTLTYDPNNFRLTRLLTISGSGTLQNYGYAYDATGNLTQITDSVGTGGRTFAYDALNRLVRGGGWSNGLIEDYAYDVVGNLQQRASLVYAYSNPSHPWAATALSDGRTYAYDAGGSATNDAGPVLTWTADGRLATLTSAGTTMSFAYDALGQRVKTTTPSGVTRAPFPGYEVDAAGVVRKSFGFFSKQGTQVRFYHDDPLGSTNVVTDVNGFAVQHVEYSPWGQVVRLDGTVEPRPRFRTADVSDRSRQYDPALGRMLSVDPSAIDLTDPQTVNRYTYARNNPVTPVLRRPDGGPSDF